MDDRNSSTSSGQSATQAIFTDALGASITVPADEMMRYATVKAEQAAALTDLLSDASAGFEIALTPMVIDTFTALARELTHTTAKLVMALAENADKLAESQKGGAA